MAIFLLDKYQFLLLFIVINKCGIRVLHGLRIIWRSMSNHHWCYTVHKANSIHRELDTLNRLDKRYIFNGCNKVQDDACIIFG